MRFLTVAPHLAGHPVGFSSTGKWPKPTLIWQGMALPHMTRTENDQPPEARSTCPPNLKRIPDSIFSAKV
jgi:hypothetical protein